MKELREKYQGLFDQIKEAFDILDIKTKKDDIGKLKTLSLDPDFWQKENAKDIMQKISNLEGNVLSWEKLYNDVRDSLDIVLITEEKEHEIVKELEEKISVLEKEYEKLETQLFLGGKYDQGNAIISIYSGAGGVDAQDWAEMLLRMYLKYAEKEGFKSDILEITQGDVAGIKNVTIAVKGIFAYGFLKNERGVHRLVRLSPYDADHARHTSFALVELYPEIEEREFKLDEKDLKIETFRASGHGGQSVNTTDSAVRITHLPTGLVATCQNERSQMQNKNSALKVLASKIKLFEEKEKKEEEREIRGETISAEWGSQIRSYVLHPYNLVKDLRTDYETSDTSGVLEGNIRCFIDANLKKSARK